jgi:predicted HTH domain antitoxin
MSLSLTIPEEIISAVKIPRPQLKLALSREMAFTMYSQGIASMGTARRFAKLTKWEFLDELAKRGITRHYYENELKEDISYAKSSQ